METQSQLSGDCLEAVITKHSDMVYKLALAQTKNAADADDVYQDVFLRFIKKKPDFESDEHQKAWFLRVTINCSKSMSSSAWRKKTLPLDESMEHTTKEQLDLLSELQKLPKKYSAVIHLFYYEDMSINEISNVISKSPSAVKMRLSRARKMLKGIIKEEDYV